VHQLSFGPEKVVAEAAMLLHSASQAGDRPEVRRRVDAVAHQLIPLVRSQRALVDIALQPGRAFKLAVPHVLLTTLGHHDEPFDQVFLSRCSVALEMAGDLPPSALFERRWITSHWKHDWDLHSASPVDGTFLDSAIDVLSDSREDAYSLTHLLFYLTDFGGGVLPALSRPVDTVLSEVEALLLRYLDSEDYDLAGELLMAWPLLRAPWSPVPAFAFRVLASVEDDAGMLPCGNVDVERLGRLDSAERGRYALATAYHTAFVMGFLCAVSLRPDCAPPVKVQGREFAALISQQFLGFVGDDQGHWLQVYAECDDSEKRTLAPLLCQFAVLQNLRKHDYEAVRDILLLAKRVGMPEHPLSTRAADLLSALGASMEVFGSSS
jgi:hypothetical protein